MSSQVPYQNSVHELKDALDHIFRMASASKTQTKQLRRIAMRAEKAVSGKVFNHKEARELPNKIRGPQSYEHEIRILKREIAELKSNGGCDASGNKA